MRAFSRGSHARIGGLRASRAVKRYGFTILACVIVAALAILMTGAATRGGSPPPVLLDEAPSQVDVAKPARTPWAGQPRRRPAARRAGPSQRERADRAPVVRAAAGDAGRESERERPPARQRPAAGGGDEPADDGPGGIPVAGDDDADDDLDEGDVGDDAAGDAGDDGAEQEAPAPPPAPPAPAEDDDEGADEVDDVEEDD
jgi:hypothetical protein